MSGPPTCSQLRVEARQALAVAGREALQRRGRLVEVERQRPRSARPAAGGRRASGERRQRSAVPLEVAGAQIAGDAAASG